jgi:alkanesulfonate monooxygenase SsuD/methylene tetrahydromethanopterin reductase-like flavin-dependent oxidoreductase (luciferase family)
VTNPTFRDPLSTLSAISTVALLALGRVLLGIGTGYTGASGRAALEAYVETGFHDHHVGDAAGLSQPDRAGRGDDDRYGRRVPCCPRS